MTDLADRLGGSLAARYVVERELGHGGMATVFLARDLKHGRLVAVKVLRPELAASIGPARFLREIRVAANLTHPHILPLHDSGEADGLLYYVMPYIEGESLRARFARKGQLDLEEVARIGGEVADALDYAHQHGIVHRDIKPENILISGYSTRDSGASGGHAVVADFGIARAVTSGTETLTDAGFAVGTPMYMSPEQAAGDPELDGRSDIFSLGCVLFEAITGRPPYSGPNQQAILTCRMIQIPEPVQSLRPETPAVLAETIARALARNPADRFATAAGLSNALGASISAFSGGPAPAVRVPSISGPHSRATVSVAVLPFVNLSADKDNEYFSDGMTEELINGLAQVPGLRVAPRSSAFASRGQGHDVRVIGERLRVAAVVEGSVRRAGNRLRIAAQLIDTVTGYHLWSEIFERQMEDVFALQDEISRTIVNKLRVTLVHGPEAPLVRPATASLDAYHHYLKGRYFWNQRTVDSIHRAIAQFEQATKADPDYSLPYTGVADAYHLLSVYGAVPPRQAYPKVKAAALRALELDPMSAEAHTALGCTAFCFEWDWAGAERALLKALELEPRYAYGCLWYAWCLTARSRFEEAVGMIRHAIELEPMSLGINGVAGYILSYCGRYDEAVNQCLKTLDLQPGLDTAIDGLALAYYRKGMLPESLAIYERNKLGIIGTQAMRLGTTFAAMGKTEAARRIVAEEEARWAAGGAPGTTGYNVAGILAILGERDQALTWLERDFEDRRFLICLMNIDPKFASLRQEPRFRAMVARMGLSAADS